MKFTFLAVVLLVCAIVFSLAVTKTELVSLRTESSFVKFKIKDLREHGISLIAPSEPSFAVSKTVTINPYSILLKNASGRAVVGYSITWECFDGERESAERDMSHDVRISNILGVVLTRGEESDRQAVLSSLERQVIKPRTTWLISDDAPARQVGNGVEDVGTELDQAALAEVRAACPIMTVTLDGIFFDDGTFIGPDTSNFFLKVKTQLDARYELLQWVQNELKAGKSPGDVFKGLEQIRDREGQPQGEELTMAELRAYFRKKYAQDVLGKKEMWGPDKAIEDIQQLLSKPWAKLRKL
jgi:hypothetical protein